MYSSFNFAEIYIQCTVCIGKLRSEAPLQDSNLIEHNIRGQIFFCVFRFNASKIYIGDI